MKFSISRTIFAAILFSLSLSFLCTAQTSVWTLNSRSEIDKGDAKGISIGPNGLITPAPKLTEIFRTGQAYIWSSTIDPAGNIYLGTGGEGRIYKIAPDGKGSLFCDLTELNVSALAIAKDGALLAASSPDGKVYSIDNAGKATSYFDPKEKYIWSMAVMKDGSLAVGTGEGGKVFRVKQANATPADSLFYDSSESHMITLRTDKNGVLYAGTDSNGLVLRIDDQGNAFAVLDSPLREIHDLTFAPDGSLYALAVGESASSTTSPTTAAAPTPAPASATVPKGKKSAAAVPTVKSRYDLSSAKSAVYKIEPSGSNRIIWSSTNVIGFSLNATQDGGVLLGTSDKGRIYRIANNCSETLLIQSEAGQISTLRTNGNVVFATSSNDGRLYRFTVNTLDQGSYESPILDAGSFAGWGRIWWNSTSDVEVETRSGNTETPGSTWSKWANTPNTRSAQITSPPARFLQWRAVLKPGTSLSDVNVAYLANNIGPEILTVTILPANIGLAANPSPQIDPNIESVGLDPQDFGLSIAPVPPRKIYQRGAVSFQWTAEDRNEDKLIYDVLYKAAGSNNYKPLAAGISDNFYTLDGLAFADGQYTIKIVARDILSNTSANALFGEKSSEPFEIDNSQPIVTVLGQPVLKNGMAELKFKATDRSGYIVRAEYSINGGTWKTALPDDGISDSPEEVYTVKIPVTSGEDTVTLRVFDASGNAGNGRATTK